MNKPEKKSFIIGGSILGGLVFAFVLYRKFKSKPETTTLEDLDSDSDSDLGNYEEQITNALGKRTFLPSSDDDSNLLLNSDDDSNLLLNSDDDNVSVTSLTESKSGGQKKKKSRRKRKPNKSKKNRKRRSKKNKKSRK